MAARKVNDASVTLRLPQRQADRWRSNAKAAGMTVSEWVRSSVGDDGKVRVHRVRAADEVEAHRQRTAELAKIGNNLNQIAHCVNAGAPITEEILAALLELKEATERVD